MTKQVLKQKAADGNYFHRDFHIALNYGIEYLHRRFGRESVGEYLAQFACNYYAPLKKKLIGTGLSVIKEHYEKTYRTEGARYEMNLSDDELLVHLFASPAVGHIKASGHHVSPLFRETVNTVNRELCRDTPFDCEMTAYDLENGAYRLRFYKR